MSDTERARLLSRLREVLGDEEAAYLMENLPPQPWHELATKADLETLATKADLETLATKADLETLATKADLETLATDVDLLAGKLDATRGDVAALSSQADATRADLAALSSQADATRADLAALSSQADATRADLAALSSKMDTEVASKTELEAAVTGLRGEMVHLGEKLELKLDAHASRTEALVRERIDAQTKLLMFSVLGALLTTAAIAVGAVGLGT